MRLPLVHGRYVDVHAHVGVGSGFGSGAGDAGAAQVLNADDQTGVEQRQRRLDQALLLEGVAHLHAGALGLVALGELGRGEHAHPADAVAAGGVAQQHRQVALAGGLGQHQPLGGQNAQAEHVDQRVLGVCLVEHHLAANGGDADRVAVAGHARHHALGDPAAAGVVERAEPQRVHQRNRAGAHSEDVAHDAADARGRALVGLDGGRVVVALDAQCHGDAVAHVDHAGVLTRADQHPRGLGREPAQVHPGALVGAVLGPHHRVHRQLEVVALPAEQFADLGELVVGEPERLMERRLGATALGVEVGCLGGGVAHTTHPTDPLA